MLKHIVMMKLKPANDDELKSRIAQLKNMLELLGHSIKELHKIEVGVNISTRAAAYDLVLMSEFKSEEELNIYRTHKEHVKVLDYLKIWVDETKVVDYFETK